MQQVLKDYWFRNKYIKTLDWDIPNWSRALTFLDKHKQNKFDGKKVLEIGANNGTLSVWAAINGAQVICSDIDGPSEFAEKRINQLKLKNVDFEYLDVLNLVYKNEFDFILFKSLLGGIGRKNCIEKQVLVMKKINQALIPGGECLFIENMKGLWFHQFYRNRYGAGKNDWHYPSLKEFNQFSKLFNKVSYRTFGFIGVNNFPLKNIRAKLDPYLEHIIHPNWNYIYAGIFRK